MTTRILTVNDAESGASKPAVDVFKAALRTPEFAACACVVLLAGSAFAINLAAGLRWASSDADIYVPLAFLAPLYAAARYWKATAAFAEIILYGALYVVMSLSLTKLTYLGFRLRLPLQDSAFRQADAAIGFDWNVWQAFLHARPMLLDTLDWCYKSHSWQLALTLCVLPFVKPRTGNAFLLLSLSIAGLITAAVSALLPAIGPGDSAGWPVPNAPVIHAIREGSNAPLPYLGIISFPSYHTVMAILFTYVYREVKWMLAPAAALNTLVLFAVPFSGNHYVIDIAGGAIVAFIGIQTAGALIKRFRY